MEGLKEDVDKISSYNIFNYLLPGILFPYLLKELVGYDLIQDNILIGVFLYYFIGLVISRFGSIFIEPLLKKIKFVKFANYKDFVSASKKDNKIELLSEVNNTYRTLLSMLLLLVVCRLYIYVKSRFNLSNDFTLMLVITFLVIIFLYSYRKQTNYITKRIEANN